ncbi:SWIM zinc finger domain-containing protein [Dyadobacter sp. NIV53]|uniref:SWIM zinc finger family protein n=1 Tax=Dyadobacter sp. NIV53 TaxID=2861765 RepID=UPI001C881B37|nr:SWIM zinc finger family protein [Dyadobacter sp. NIV53]
MPYTKARVLELAPDDASAKAGLQLASNAKWVVKSVNTKALWGDCQGSGKTPYKTIVDLSNIAFKCSCPSRKLPCKHGLGLLLLYTQQPDVFSYEENLPAEVSLWLDKREVKEIVKEQKEPKSVDEPAKKKREEARYKKVDAGIQELRSWISDVVRSGIMTVPQNIYQFNQNITARMIDAQAGGLANQLRQINKIDFYKDGWQKALIKRLSKIYLITEAFQRKENLPPALVQELQTLIGWTTSKEDVLQSESIRDKWTILSITINEEDNLRVERIWLYGNEKKRYALILNFYAGSQMPEHLLMKGTQLNADLAYFPGLNPMRALIKNREPVLETAFQIETTDQILSVFEIVTNTLSANPFTEQIPFIINNVSLVYDRQNWWIKDKNNDAVSLSNYTDACWKMLAFSKGKVCSVFGIYENEKFELFTIWSKDKTCFVK